MKSFDDLFGDEENKPISDDALKAVASISERLLRKQLDLVTLTDAVKKLSEEIAVIETSELPEAMDELGLKKFTLTSGEEVKVDDVVRASIPVASPRAPEAYKWLIDNKHGDLIKTEITTALGRGEYEKAKEICEYIKTKFGVDAAAAQAVHHGTLSAWAKEQLQAGKTLPMELLGVFAGRKATVK